MLNTQSISPIILRSHMVDSLAKIRHEWEQAADGVNLTEMETNVGLLLVDLALGIGLTSEEQTQALGAELVNELQGILFPTVGNNGNR